MFNKEIKIFTSPSIMEGFFFDLSIDLVENKVVYFDKKGKIIQPEREQFPLKMKSLLNNSCIIILR